MYVVQRQDVANVLGEFGIYEKISAIDIEAYYALENNVCIVIKVTGDKGEYIIKLIHDVNVYEEKENLQADFSEKLRNQGLSIPKKYQQMSEQSFTGKIYINNIYFWVQVEDYYGIDVQCVSYDLINFIGHFLGIAHGVSWQGQWCIGDGSTYKAIFGNRVQFEKIIGNDLINLLDDTLVYESKKIHNCCMQEIKEIWSQLPKATVHGDLGILNNVVCNKDGFGVIDFNLAGDECLLGDMLITWYSSRYSMLIARNIDLDTIQNLFDVYCKAYFSERLLNENETKYMEKVACFLNGIYFLKYLNNLHSYGYTKLALEYSKDILKNYRQLDAGIDMRKYYE